MAGPNGLPQEILRQVTTDLSIQNASPIIESNGIALSFKLYTKYLILVLLGDIGSTIQEHVEANGCSVVQDFCGHGIGQTFHKEPNILHYGKKGTGEKIKAGMIFTIEPMINLGNYETKTLNDGWTAVTKDKSLSAQFEHTVGITKDGYEIFTQSKKFS